MEANWSAIVSLLIITWFAVWLGRVWFRRWFNPLSLYSAIWGFCLVNYELRLIQYYPISTFAWACIALAWVSLYLGTATALPGGLVGKRYASLGLSADLRHLRTAIVVLSVIGGIGVADQVRVVIREFGGVLEALVVNAGELYLSRSAGELSFIPYASVVAYGASSLAGVYTALVGRPTIVASVPLALVALTQVFSMSRLGLGTATVLFLSCYLLARRSQLKMTNAQRVLAVAVVLVTLAGGFVLVSSTRGLGVDFPGITSPMEWISEYIPVFPSLYSSFSASPVAFSQYLSGPEKEKRGGWGQYTFAPVLRFLSKFGFPTYVERLEENYYTPVPMNTSTYLKNTYSDFGFLGILFFPYLLGFFTGNLTLRTQTEASLTALVVLSNLYVLVVFSFAFNLMFLGEWYVSMITGTLAAVWVERRTKLAQHARSRGSVVIQHSRRAEPKA